jgi:hypothetical protein
MKVRLPTLRVSKEELLADLKRVSEMISSDSLRAADYEKNGKFACTSFRNHFGSWRNALEIVGLTRSRNWGSQPEEMLENMRDVWLKLGRQPKLSDMTIPFSRYSSSAYTHKFGSWTAALRTFQKFVDQDVNEGVNSSGNLTPALPGNGRKPNRSPNWRLRFKVLQRDQFQCVGCGASPSKTAGVELHVDHIKPWSKGGETELNNLQTLCKICNLGKGNIDA